MFGLFKFLQPKTAPATHLFPLFVVGRVLEVLPHPQADRLHLTKVDVGDQVLDIVCGAPNVAANQFVVVAKIGAQMPDGPVIAPVSLRGVMSYGMLCSAKELGLGEDHDGIMILDSAKIDRPGLSLDNYLAK